MNDNNYMTAIKIALKIAQEQIDEFPTKIKPDIRNIPLAEQKESIQREAEYLYIKNFWDQYEFLFCKLETEKETDFHFFLPLCRILMEIYGEFLYFLNQDERTKIGIFTGKYLLRHSDYYRFITPQSKDIKKEYDRFLNILGSILTDQNILFPSDIILFSKRCIKDIGFDFPKFDFIFQQKYFEELSVETFRWWEKDGAENFYNKYYRIYSDYTHIGFTNQTAGYTKTEKFWITQFLYIIGQLMVELCNKMVFASSYNNKFSQLCDQIAKDHRVLLRAWDESKRDNCQDRG